jgi:hypothetical protein
VANAATDPANASCWLPCAWLSRLKVPSSSSGWVPIEVLGDILYLRADDRQCRLDDGRDLSDSMAILRLMRLGSVSS